MVLLKIVPADEGEDIYTCIQVKNNNNNKKAKYYVQVKK